MTVSDFTPAKTWQGWVGLVIAVIVIVAVAKKVPVVKSYV